MTTPGARTEPLSADSPPPVLEGIQLRRIADDGTVLLDDVSIGIFDGESVAIVGPPGAGKTLLLRALALVDPLDGGEVRFRGNSPVPHEAPLFRRNVLYVQQRPALVEGTVRENLLLPFAFRSGNGEQFDSTRVESWLEAVGRSSRFLDRTAADLSGGESQIVALIRALQLNPAVLLLDEPTSSLDVRTREQVEALLQTWKTQSENPALVIVTHDEAQAERMADRRVGLEHGRVVGSGETP